MFLAYESFKSSVRPRIFGLITVGSETFSICRFNVVLYSSASGMKNLVVVLS